MTFLAILTLIVSVAALHSATTRLLELRRSQWLRYRIQGTPVPALVRVAVFNRYH